MADRTPVDLAADAIQAEIKAHPTFDPKPFGAIGSFALGATMHELASAAFASIDAAALAAEIGRHGPTDADSVPGGMDCRCGLGTGAWEHIEEADRHVAESVKAWLTRPRRFATGGPLDPAAPSPFAGLAGCDYVIPEV